MDWYPLWNSLRIAAISTVIIFFAGIFAAYELSHLRPGLKLLALDQGQDIYHRSCPIVA